MTLELLIVRAWLKELRALERVRRAIARSSGDPDWLYVVAALDTKLSELRAQLAREDPEVLAEAERESAPVSSDAHLGITTHLPKMPAGSRIH